MNTRANLRHFSTDLIMEFWRHTHPEIPFEFTKWLIIVLYVNFLALFRSRLETISADFDGRSLRLAAQRSGPGPVACSPGAGAFHSESITVASDRTRSRVAAGARERESEKGKNRKAETGTPSPLDHLFAVGFFNVLRFFTNEQKILGGAG